MTAWCRFVTAQGASLGPVLVTGFDLRSAPTTIRVNGAVDSSFATGAMIFEHIDYVTEMAKYLTLFPGDVLWMGADGTGRLVSGDWVEIEIDGIGTLRNHVVDEVP